MTNGFNPKRASVHLQIQQLQLLQQTTSHQYTSVSVKYLVIRKLQDLAECSYRIKLHFMVVWFTRASLS